MDDTLIVYDGKYSKAEEILQRADSWNEAIKFTAEEEHNNGKHNGEHNNGEHNEEHSKKRKEI